MATTTDDFQVALKAVDKAIALVNSVAAASPTESFRQKLGDLFHRHRTKQAKSTDVIPVSGILNDIKQVNAAGVENVNTKLERVKGKLEQVSTPESEADLIDASDDVGYLEIDLPVQQTKTLLMEAHAAILNEGRGQRQRGALGRADAHQDVDREGPRRRRRSRRRRTEIPRERPGRRMPARASHFARRR